MVQPGGGGAAAVQLDAGGAAADQLDTGGAATGQLRGGRAAANKPGKEKQLLVNKEEGVRLWVYL